MHDEVCSAVADGVLSHQDPFWPKVEVKVLREHLRLTPATSDARLRVAAHSAMIQVAREFAQWRWQLRDRGYKQLADLCDGDSCSLNFCYLRALVEHTRKALQAYRLSIDLEAPAGPGEVGDE
ncbi:head completion/stabilization protein [Pseudomonas rubra]|uniref:Head completion/stabilization protein n=1 Tax=Pseudomonas rubra TaxID=2942627 RepID=A0ABT5P1I8_9PSED|nr:head completion/stabilization protein [Pseudomonas rubra]MDD1012132.1 head completion/stabilization protein [Pseudomonas rubra]MDD1038432.1 head completion/stabilization protein [Pseudomonas rubra]MDD1153469.1 head completion/stabilization protein [Pseudomonas rubra]